MRQPVFLTIPQPCHQSWAAMTPAAAGRHCAACEKTVVDFTRKTDAEILAFLAGAASGRTCGRFAAGQLERPLQRAVPAASTGRWGGAWLAAAIAVWGLREGSSMATYAQAPAEWRVRYWGGPVPIEPLVTEASVEMAGRERVLRGVVRDYVTQQPLAQVAVFLKGENHQTTTDSAGHFQLPPTTQPPHGRRALVLHRTGYLSETIPLPLQVQADEVLMLALRPDPAASGVEVVGISRSEQRVIVMGMMPLPGMPLLHLPVAKPRATTPNRWLQRLFRGN